MCGIAVYSLSVWTRASINLLRGGIPYTNTDKTQGVCVYVIESVHLRACDELVHFLQLKSLETRCSPNKIPLLCALHWIRDLLGALLLQLSSLLFLQFAGALGRTCTQLVFIMLCFAIIGCWVSGSERLWQRKSLANELFPKTLNQCCGSSKRQSFVCISKSQTAERKQASTKQVKLTHFRSYLQIQQTSNA